MSKSNFAALLLWSSNALGYITGHCASDLAYLRFPPRTGLFSTCCKAQIKVGMVKTQTRMQCSVGTVNAPHRSALLSGDRDPFDIGSLDFINFTRECTKSFETNGWTHVPSYLLPEETERLLLEAKNCLENVSFKISAFRFVK